LNNSVHENVRRSINSLAWRASFDLLRIDGGAQAVGLLPQFGGTGLVASRFSGQLRIAARIAQHTADVEERRGGDENCSDEQPGMYRSFVVERPRRKVGADHAVTV
jgi:hypothetical protein